MADQMASLQQAAESARQAAESVAAKIGEAGAAPAPVAPSAEAPVPRHQVAAGWAYYLGFFVLLQLAFVVGWVASTRASLGSEWKPILLAAAGLTVGFGAAALLFNVWRARRQAMLAARFEVLQQRSKALMESYRDYERRKAMPSTAATIEARAAQAEALVAARPYPR